MLSPIFDYSKENGLVYCDEFADTRNEAERLYISEIKDLNPHAVLFRRYYNDINNEPCYSDPAVCIFTSDQVEFNSKTHSKLQAVLWSESKCEVYMILEDSRIDIFNARKPTKIERKNGQKVLNLESLKLASVAINEIDKSNHFSAYNFFCRFSKHFLKKVRDPKNKFLI